MIKPQTLLAAALLSLFAAPAAQALSDVAAVANGNQVLDLIVDADARSLGLDVDFTGLGPVTLSFTLDAEDIASGYAFNSNLGNLTGSLSDGVALRLSAGSFTTGGARALFSDLESISTFDGGRGARVLSAGGEPYGFVLGDPTGTTGLADWRFDFSGLSAGQTVMLSVSAVPEPETYALFGLGLGALAFARRRRGR